MYNCSQVQENNLIILGTNDGIRQVKYVDKRLKLPYCQLLKNREVTNLVRKGDDYLALGRTCKDYMLYLVNM